MPLTSRGNIFIGIAPPGATRTLSGPDQTFTMMVMAETKGRDGSGTGEAADGRERRASARLPIEMWVEDITDGIVFRRAGNLSRGGLYLDQTIPMPVGTTIKLRFTLPGETGALEVNGQIVSINSQKTLGMSVKFVDLDPAIAATIGAYVDREGTPPLGVAVR
jgi:hypothetical protein